MLAIVRLQIIWQTLSVIIGESMIIQKLTTQVYTWVRVRKQIVRQRFNAASLKILKHYGLT